MVGTYVLKFDKIIDETPEVKTFCINIPSEVNYITGQFFMLRVYDKDGNAINETRAYSCSSHSKMKDHLEFTIQIVGSFTHKLWERKVGDKVEVKGPFGHFQFKDEMKEDILMIGAGSGVTPLRAILRHVHDSKLSNKVTLLYTCRRPELVIYKKEFEDIMKSNPNIKIIFTITRLQEGDNWKGLSGRISKELITQYGGAVKTSRAYLCGPVAFTKDMSKVLEELGINKDMMRIEAWG